MKRLLDNAELLVGMGIGIVVCHTGDVGFPWWIVVLAATGAVAGTLLAVVDWARER